MKLKKIINKIGIFIQILLDIFILIATLTLIFKILILYGINKVEPTNIELLTTLILIIVTFRIIDRAKKSNIKNDNLTIGNDKIIQLLLDTQNKSNQLLEHLQSKLNKTLDNDEIFQKANELRVKNYENILTICNNIYNNSNKNNVESLIKAIETIPTKNGNEDISKLRIEILEALQTTNEIVTKLAEFQIKRMKSDIEERTLITKQIEEIENKEKLFLEGKLTNLIKEENE